MTKENLPFSLLVALLVGLLSFAMIRGLDLLPKELGLGMRYEFLLEPQHHLSFVGQLEEQTSLLEIAMCMVL
jgi:hypothetical protein